MRNWKGAILAVLVVALVVNAGIGFKLGMSRPATSDAGYYLDIARNVADGGGFALDHGFWPGQPTASRLPGWPLFVAPFLRLFSSADPNLVIRVVCLVVNVLAAVFVALLTLRIIRSPVAATAAGFLYVAHPVAINAAVEGLSEPLFIVMTAAGAFLLLGATPVSRWGGMACLGLACTIRAHLILWPFFAVPVAVILQWREVQQKWRTRLFPVLAGTALLLLPSGLWAVRNFAVSGEFPVISTISGQTFYGGNNDVVADTLEWWGYWVFPDAIPGERAMSELAGSMSEFEVEKYYHRRGREYVEGHKSAMPRLCLGKLVRAYVPIPWKPSLGTWGVCGYRWLLYAGIVLGLPAALRRIGPAYWSILGGMAATTAVSVLVFWGCARFAFASEPFLLPIAVLPLDRMWSLLSVRLRG
jgi:hypothetical protein